MPASPPAQVPFAVLSPPDAVPSELPVVTRVQQLPFGGLTWENFERLCHRMTALEGDVEHCARYGRHGDAQEGIDIFARQADGRYHCLQAKRHRTFDAAKVRDAVDLFLAGSWVTRAARFTIAVQASLRSTAVQEEIERQAARLREMRIAFATLDGEDLTDRLRDQPLIVDDFFGRPWVAALQGEEVANSLGTRLDRASFARVRAELARVYAAQFQSVDPGSFGSISDDDGRPALTLLERFLKPDMLLRESARPLERSDLTSAESEKSVGGAAASSLRMSPDGNRPNELVANSRMRRLTLAEWLGDSQRAVVLGDAGCGKSTLLRVVALDLLDGQTHFPELAERWGQRIPIYIPFARWASQVARDGNQIGIKEIVRRSLGQLLTESIVDLLDRAIDEQRIVLLIDGLDEWSSARAAQTTLSLLVTAVEAHDVPVIVSGRPRGLNRIGSLPASWKRGTVAPLSIAQQKAIAQRWFERHATGASEGAGPSEATLRISRFMADLARDASLGALAVVPLILVGLVTLALRGQILPRTRADVYCQLVRILLEVHPDSRATAAGDTESRFQHATDPYQRRAALARLAFVIRDQTGGAGMSQSDAKKILCAFLSSPQGFELAKADAAAAAVEILSVNAETQGLVVEKAPKEVGFVHASFEEFLCAEHIGGRPFSEIETFVRAQAGEGRWRNVIVNLLSYIQRRDEFNRLVEIIESPDTDELASLNRQALLGDIAFGAALRAPATAKRLALATMDRVESEDWLPARQEALASVLKGATDPMLKDDVGQRLGRWLPARNSYSRAALIETLGEWKPTDRLQDILLKGMRDEDRRVQRAAAAAYAKAFAASPVAGQRLLDGLANTRDLASAVAMLESLAYGWKDVPEAAPLFEEARKSQSAELSLVGILGLAATGKVTADARDSVLRNQSWWSDVSYAYRELAATMLVRYWPDDEALVTGALGRVSRHPGSISKHDEALVNDAQRRVYRHSNSIWEHDVAISYLMESSVDRADVRAWILAELGRDIPFTLRHDERIWSQVGRFAAADPQIRDAANAYWCKSNNRVFRMYQLPGYVAKVADPSVAATLVKMLAEKKPDMGRYWALKSLLAGWGRWHPEVKSAIDALAEAADDDICDLVALLPDIMVDKAAARERLIQMGAHKDVQRNLLAVGLQGCGSDSRDNDAVAAILTIPKPRSNMLAPIFQAFGAHPSVRALAWERIQEFGGPLAEVSGSYADDPEFEPVLFDAAVPLPIDLRTQIVEVAAMGASGTALEAVLSKSSTESDPELRVRMVIAHHRELPKESIAAVRNALLIDAVAQGAHNEVVRAAALAGLATIGELDALATLKEHGKPVALVTSHYGQRVGSVERLICERFADFVSVFGDYLPERFESSTHKRTIAGILSAAPGASPASRAAFLELAERGEMPLTPHALRALAAERPHSDLLLKRCWDTLGSGDHANNNRAMVNAEVGLILRKHFGGDPDVRQRLVERSKRAPSTVTAIPLAIFAPDADELPLLTSFDTLGREFADWTVAAHVAAQRADSTTFSRLLEAIVTRQRRSPFDAQQVTNLAVEERLQGDPELVGLLTARIETSSNPTVSGSFARYLAAAGKLDLEGREKAIALLQALGRGRRLPVAGYDAIADKWRTTRATLLDAVSAGLELT